MSTSSAAPAETAAALLPTPDHGTAPHAYRTLRNQYAEAPARLQRSRNDNMRLLQEIKAYRKVLLGSELPPGADCGSIRCTYAHTWARMHPLDRKRASLRVFAPTGS